MPLYEYECDACGHRFEVIQRFSDPPVGTCRVCGGPVHKLLSPAAIQFKGSGWYVTDYASPERKKAIEAKGKTHTKTENKTDVKKKSKTDAKTEAVSKK